MSELAGFFLGTGIAIGGVYLGMGIRDGLCRLADGLLRIGNAMESRR